MRRKQTLLFFKEHFSLWTGKEAGKYTIEQAEKSSVIKGANLWILLLAIIICSVGLNINSTAVVIGAMLISPLMGPIIAIGIGLAIYDTNLLAKGTKNLALAFVVSLCISVLYFYISPLDQATTEISSRISPTIRDVVIALSGGLVGAIALTRKEKSLTFVPGVAIATALMPPLCVTGYWITQGNFLYAAKSFYLLFINCIFIAGATFFIARLLHLPKKIYPDSIQKNKVLVVVWAVIVLTLIPSAWTTISLVEQTFIDTQVRVFSRDIAEKNSIQIMQKSINYDKKHLSLRVVGKYLSEQDIKILQNDLQNYGSLYDYELDIQQGVESDPSQTENIVKPLLSDALTSQEEQTLQLINQSLLTYASNLPIDMTQLFEEARSINIKILALDKSVGLSGESYIVTSDERLNRKERTQISRWMENKTKQEQVVIDWEIVEKEE